MAKRESGRTGPVTPGGKAITSQNAIKHGMCSRAPIVKDEDPGERERVIASWFAKYQPVDECERGLVMDVAENDWFKQRAVKQFREVDENLNSLDPFEWSLEQHQLFERVLRYKTTAERAFTRSLRTLEQQRKIQVLEEEAAEEMEKKELWRQPLRSFEEMVTVMVDEGPLLRQEHSTNEMPWRRPTRLDREDWPGATSDDPAQQLKPTS